MSCATVANGESDVQTALGVHAHKVTEYLITVVVFAFACLYLFPLRDFVTLNADEGITLVDADRILRGQIPYRDFFTFVTPGSPYLMALWFRLFGTTLVVARSVLLVYAGTFAAINYRLARRNCARTGSLFAAMLLTCGAMPCRLLVLHNWDSTLFALLTIYCAQKRLDSYSRHWSLFIGVTTSLTFLTEQSKGAGLLLGLCLGGAALWRFRQRPMREVANDVCFAMAGFAIPLTLTLAYFGSKHAVSPMLQSWLWPLSHYTTVNRAFYGFLGYSPAYLQQMYLSEPWKVRIFMIIFTSPMVTISALAIFIVAATLYSIASLRRPGQSLEPVLGGCIFMGVLLSAFGTGRADFSHVLYLTPLFFYLVPCLLDFHHPKLVTLHRATPILAALLLISFTGFGITTLMNAMSATEGLSSRRGVVRLGFADTVLPFVQSNLPAGQHVYVHPYQPFYSFMTGTINPTRYDFLQAGMATEDQYESTIFDLQRDQTPVVLLETNFSDTISQIWPSTPISALARDPVADYILRHYRTCTFLNSTANTPWGVYYMVRSDLRCPLSTGGQAL